MQEARLVAVWVILLSFVIAIPSVMAAQQWDEKICWKKSQVRGVGKIPVCEQKQEKDAGLCYGACKPGFKGVGPVCWKECPSGYHDDGATCRRDAHIVKKDSYGRGAGKVGKIEEGQKQAGLWYKACRDGYKGVGPVCWKECPSGHHDDGATCRRDAHIVKKDSYGRGAGTVPKSCPAGQHFDAGLCYSTCTPGYKGVGPVCWPECKNLSAKGIKMNTECGAACSTDRDACSKWAGAWVTDGFGILGDAVEAIDPSKIAELTDSVRKYPANIPYCQ